MYALLNSDCAWADPASALRLRFSAAGFSVGVALGWKDDLLVWAAAAQSSSTITQIDALGTLPLKDKLNCQHHVPRTPYCWETWISS